MQYLKSVWTGFKGLDEEKKFFLIVVIAVALLVASGHTYVFIKKL